MAKRHRFEIVWNEIAVRVAEGGNWRQSCVLQVVNCTPDTVQLFRQPCFSQAVGERRGILRSVHREPIRKIGDAERGIELPQIVHRSLRPVGPQAHGSPR